MHPIQKYRVLCVLLSAMVCTVALGAGPTGEEEALSYLNTNRFPLALSADGQWVFHVDAGNVLYRKRVSDEKIVGALKMARRVYGLSATRDGTAVGLVADNGCVGIASFPQMETTAQPSAPTKTPKLTWLNGEQGGSPLSQVRCAGVQSAALSSDGKLMAILDASIRVIDLATRRTVLVVPVSAGASVSVAAPVFHLQFVDADRKLFVAQAILGEQWESPAEGSDMQFFVWDLRKKELFNFHNTKTRGNLLPYDYHWSFSELTGELWAINTNGSYWETDGAGKQKRSRALIQPYTTNLKHCASVKQEKLKLTPSESDGWLSFAADPLGRWTAIAEPTFDKKLKRGTSVIRVRDGRSGKVLAQWPVDSEVRSLTSSSDGTILFGTTGGQLVSTRDSANRADFIFTGGGQLVKFDMSSVVKGLPAIAASPWAEARCLVEDEKPDARNIAIDNKVRAVTYEIPLTDRDSLLACGADQSSLTSGENSNAWRQTRDGAIFIDRLSTLERIDPANGLVLQRVPTPRSGSVCSLPLYENRQFLSWQGDTLTLRPFADTLSNETRRVLVRKPGWFAESVVLLGDFIGVRWIDNRYKDVRDDPSGLEELSGPGKPMEGSALASVYDMSGKAVAEVSGRALNGRTFFEMEDGEGATSVFEKFQGGGQEQGEYRWQRSYASSIRAFRRDESAKTEHTVLWSGLRSEDQSPEMADIGSDGFADGTVLRLGGPLGAILFRYEVQVLADAVGAVFHHDVER